MKYEVTKEHADRFESVVNEDDNSDVRACITRALADFVAGIPEPPVATAPKWIKVCNRTINLRHVIAILERPGDAIKILMVGREFIEFDREFAPESFALVKAFLAGLSTPKGDA